MTLAKQPAKDYRAAIERELEERLANDATHEKTSAAAAHAQRADSAGTVKLLCLQCRSLCDADAQFCTSCGTKFNVLVVGPMRATASRREGAA
jgi:hypothetical protein